MSDLYILLTFCTELKSFQATCKLLGRLFPDPDAVLIIRRLHYHRRRSSIRCPSPLSQSALCNPVCIISLDMAELVMPNGAGDAWQTRWSELSALDAFIWAIHRSDLGSYYYTGPAFAVWHNIDVRPGPKLENS